MSELMYPTEVVTLPSKGKFYPEGHPLRENGGKLDIKYMTAKEEDILTSTNLIQNGTVFDKLLESVVIHKGVKYTQLLTGDINAVLIASRVLAYGKEYPIELECGQCNASIKHSVDLTKLESPDDLVDVNESGNYEFTTDTGLNIKIKPLTRGEELQIEKDIKAIESKLGAGVAPEITLRLKKIVTSINGETDKSKLSTMIDNLVIRDSKRIREEFKKINPTVDLTMEVACSSCGHINKGGIPIGTDFFWPDV